MSKDDFVRVLQGNFDNNIEDLTWLVEHDYIRWSSEIYGHNTYKILKSFDYIGGRPSNGYIVTKGPKHGVKKIIKGEHE